MRPLNIVLSSPPDWSDRAQPQKPVEAMHIYDPQITPWQIREEHFPRAGGVTEQLRWLLRYAILAPSSHNTQPWKFSVRENEIGIFADMSRWLAIADADRRELHISLGCAMENLLVAADYFGFDCLVNYLPESENAGPVATVLLTTAGRPTDSERSRLFPALTARHTNRNPYEPRAVSNADRRRLHSCCSKEGLSLYLTDDRDTRRKIGELTVMADEIQFADPAFRRELGFWLAQGVLGASHLISKLQGWVVAHINVGKSTAKRDAELLTSAPLWGLISSEEDDRASHIRVGQAFQRMCLTASLLGLGVQPMSQVLQVPDIRMEVRALMPDAKLFPCQPFRMGYVQPLLRHTPRRMPVEVPG